MSKQKSRAIQQLTLALKVAKSQMKKRGGFELNSARLIVDHALENYGQESDVLKSFLPKDKPNE